LKYINKVYSKTRDVEHIIKTLLTKFKGFIKVTIVCRMETKQKLIHIKIEMQEKKKKQKVKCSIKKLIRSLY